MARGKTKKRPSSSSSSSSRGGGVASSAKKAIVGLLVSAAFFRLISKSTDNFKTIQSQLRGCDEAVARYSSSPTQPQLVTLLELCWTDLNHQPSYDAIHGVPPLPPIEEGDVGAAISLQPTKIQKTMVAPSFSSSPSNAVDGDVDVDEARAALVRERALSNGLVVHAVPGDGKCLYHSLAKGLRDHGVPATMQDVRGSIMEHILEHPGDFIAGAVAWREDFKGNIIKDGRLDLLGDSDSHSLLQYYVSVHSSNVKTGKWTYGGDAELQAFAEVYGINVDVHNYERTQPTVHRIRPQGTPGDSFVSHGHLQPGPLPDIGDDNIIRISHVWGENHYEYLDPSSDAVDSHPAIAAGPSSFTDASAGVAVHNRMSANKFHKVYFQQEHALDPMQFVDDVVPTFSDGVVQYAANGEIGGVATPVNAIQADQLHRHSFFLPNNQVSGAYLSVMYVDYDDAVALADGSMDARLIGTPYEFGGVNDFRMGQIRTAVKAGLSNLRYFCTKTGCNPSSLQLALPYVGLTARQVVKHPTDPKVSRIDQHVNGGIGKSLHSAAIDLFTKSGLFEGSRHVYGAIARAKYGDKQLAAAQELFGTGAMLHHGDAFDYGNGALNVAPTGMLDVGEGGRDGMLWATCWELRVRFGSETHIDEVDKIGPTMKAAVLGSKKIQAKIVKFGGDQYEADPTTASLAILHSALTSIASDAAWTDEVRKKRKETMSKHNKVKSKKDPSKMVSEKMQAAGIASRADEAQKKRKKTVSKHNKVKSKTDPSKMVSEKLQACGDAAHSDEANKKRSATFAKTKNEKYQSWKPTILAILNDPTVTATRSDQGKKDCASCLRLVAKKEKKKVAKVGAGFKHCMCSTCLRATKTLIEWGEANGLEW